MAEFVLSTDTSCDVPRSTLAAENIPYLPLTFTINGETAFDEFNSDKEFKGFYNKIRTGAMPTTSQINPAEHLEFFSTLIEKGAKAIVHLSLSSGLSATANNAALAAAEAMEKYPSTQVFSVDTIAATQAHGFLLDRAKKMRDGGQTATDTAHALNALKHRLQTVVMAEDLMHLKRGGRISAVKAVIGTLLKVKPIFVINKTGGLTVIDKVKGIKNVFNFFIEHLKENCPDYMTGEFYIAHADCADYASELEKVLREVGCKGNITTGWIGPVIGAHTGPGTLGLICEGNERTV